MVAACMRVAIVGWGEGSTVRMCLEVESVVWVDGLNKEGEQEEGIKEILFKVSHDSMYLKFKKLDNERENLSSV